MQSENLIEPRKSLDFLAGIEAARPFSELSSPLPGVSEKSISETSLLGNGSETFPSQNHLITFGSSELRTTFLETLSGTKNYDMASLILLFYRATELFEIAKMEISKSSSSMEAFLQVSLPKPDVISFKEPQSTSFGSTKSVNSPSLTSAINEQSIAQDEFSLLLPPLQTSTVESEPLGSLTSMKNFSPETTI